MPISTFISGMPYTPGGGSAWSVVFGSLILVLAFYGLVYVYYVKQPQMPDWSPISRFQPFRQSVVFARFGNRPADENDENGDITVEFNEPSNVVGQRSAMGFNNPLFKSDNQGEQKQSMAESDATALHDNSENDGVEEHDTESIKLVDVDIDSDN